MTGYVHCDTMEFKFESLELTLSHQHEIVNPDFTPEEDSLPYDFDDIDDILAKYPSRATTLRNFGNESLRAQGQQYNIYNEQQSMYY